MKKKIHPTYYPKAKVKCACGATFEVGSTKKEIETEICSQCHPFYTGKERIIETGQVEKFRERMAKKQVTKSKKARVKKPRPDLKSGSRPQSASGKTRVKKKKKEKKND
ncbi:MAG: 50S ribosomal protein L31 [Parcubacteria group bacterium]|jgi:large subunit ribosomal protein L31|nr:50S ribosomal protein L31 [Parcubacteria group bacterium]|tara:strand:+ start:2130 stop:2456 length:327 start_codon:yes stop_codon:yes gene_type:complete